MSFQFFLASELHMTVGELQERMTPEEMLLWSGYYNHRAEEREKAERRASRRR